MFGGLGATPTTVASEPPSTGNSADVCYFNSISAANAAHYGHCPGVTGALFRWGYTEMIGWILWYFRKPSDLRTALDSYLVQLPSDAPIRNVLTSPDIENLLAKFDRSDWTAIRKQTSFRRASHLALWAGFIGAVVSALGLLPLDRWLSGWSPDVVNVLKMASTFLMSVAIMWLSFRQSGVRWFRARSEAEKARAGVFEAIIRAGAANKPLLPQALACFNSAHLEWQLGFFEKRGGEHREAARKIAKFHLMGRVLWVISALLGLVALLNLAAAFGFTIPILSAVLPWLVVADVHRWHVGLDAMAASILAFASERSTVDRNTRNASYYALAAADLQQVKNAALKQAIEAAERGDDGVVIDFRNRVQNVLDAEHRVWRQNASSELQTEVRA